jgi:hypothetical protein
MAAERGVRLMETGKQEVERFRVGDRWIEPSTGIIRTITWADNAEEQNVHYMPSDMPNETYPVTAERFRRWIEQDGYVFLTPETPDADRLDALEQQIDALAARVDALERPGEMATTSEPDVPRDCTGREVLRDQVVAYSEALFHVTGDSLIPVCILPNDGWHYGQEASFIAADWAECRILWPLAERSEA